MHRAAMSMLAAVVITGCISANPEFNSDFASIDGLKTLNGVYRNRGECAEGISPTYLSALVWPSAADIDHPAIATVVVRATDEHSLQILAYSADDLVKRAHLVQGRDFTLRSGRIRLRRGLHMAGLHVGDPMIGPYYRQDELGIDQAGHGKYRTKGAVAGLVYAVLPFALGVKEDVRFVRIRDAEDNGMAD